MTTPIEMNTESILKTLCGTSVTGRTNSCGHDHSGQAAALVRQITVAAYRQLVIEHTRDNITLDELASEADRLEQIVFVDG